MKKIVLIGGFGFLGKNLQNQLNDKEKYEKI
jgi:nucleoside-diphosphate-sugar epimerase